MHNTPGIPAAIQVNITNSPTGRQVAASSFAAALAVGLGVTDPGTDLRIRHTSVGARRSPAGGRS